jgi:hypothetical protein
MPENMKIADELIEKSLAAKTILEIEIGVVGGEEDGVEAKHDAKLYSTPEDAIMTVKTLGMGERGRYMVAATFGNVHGVYKPGNVVLTPSILNDIQTAVGAKYGVENMARSRKQDIIFSLLKAHARKGEDIYGDGVLEILQDGFGFLRSADGSYLSGPDDIYISPAQIRRFNLRTGDTISGQIQIVCENAASVLPHVRDGRLRGLGITGLKRIPIAPEIPTVSEAGIPGYEMAPSSGYIMAARTPRELVLKLNAELNKALKSPAFVEKIAPTGSDIKGGTPEEFADYIQRERVKWSGVIKAAGIKQQQ